MAEEVTFANRLSKSSNWNATKFNNSEIHDPHGRNDNNASPPTLYEYQDVVNALKNTDLASINRNSVKHLSFDDSLDSPLPLFPNSEMPLSKVTSEYSFPVYKQVSYL